ncbi:hypothetical protein ULO1_11490 [Carboxydocella sp. ULO1]|nr:hypothetical protein ULO1_11490 [Carboxydocella sp. ULO1]
MTTVLAKRAFPGSLVRAGELATPTTNTAPGSKQQPGVKTLAFRIMTPLATQGTAEEKDGSPDAGAILQGKFLDIENQAGFHLITSNGYISKKDADCRPG